MEEAGLLGQLGIDWKLFLSQAFNFFILLMVLHRFVYKPLLIAIKKRNERIQEGIDKAAEADVRLAEVDVIGKNIINKAENEATALIQDTEQKAKELEVSLQKKAEEKQLALLKQVELNYQKQQEESRNLVLKEASDLIKRLIVKTVELKPEAIDEALIKKAATAIKNEVQA